MEKREKGAENLIEKNNCENFLNLQVQEAENTKQDEVKVIHTKIHYN